MGTRQQVLRWSKESLAVPRRWCQKAALAFGKEDECVKVEALRGLSEVLVKGKKYMPVMVRVTAAPRPRLRTAIDVVVVLDVSSDMKEKMEETKEAMRVVIESLGPDNQLSLVLFDDKQQTPPADDNQHSHRVRMELKLMTEEGRQEAARVIDSLSSNEMCNHSVEEALGAANKILTERSAPEGTDRPGCIMLLSGGDGKVISSTSTLKFPVHTFGLGDDHKAMSFRSIASNSAAAGSTYSFINDGKTTDALKAFIGGVTSVAATSVKISIKAQDGFKVSSTVTESYKELQIQESGHVIEISDMYAGQTKNFIVYLQTLQGDEFSAATTVEKLVAVEGSYQLLTGSAKKEITTVTHHSSPAAAVAAELVRMKLVKQVKNIVEREDENLDVKAVLQRAWEQEIMVSAEYKAAGSTAFSDLEKDLEEMTNKSQGLPYMLSWLSCHEWQRATTMVHHSSSAFQVTATSTTTWGYRWELVREHKSHLTLLVCGVVFLFALLVMLLLRLSIFGGFWGTKLPSILPDLDIKEHHPSWPTISNKLDGLVHMTKQEEITSFFRNQKAEDMNQQIDQYLYMAIVYAAVLRARYEGTADISQDAVRDQAEVYLRSMLKRSKKYTLPSMEGAASLEHVTGEMGRYLYSTIVQSNVLVTIVPPPVLPTTTEDVKDKEIRELKEQITKLKELEDNKDKVITKLRIEITTLITQRDSCCQRATKCRNKVEDLGGSVDDDETIVIDRKIYYEQVKEIPSI